MSAPTTDDCRQRIIRLKPADRHAKNPMARLLTAWAATPEGNPDVCLQYRTSGCGCSDTGYWTIEPEMLERYGPLPFTARGRTIRWRWWHSLFGEASFTVYYDDVAEDR